MEWHSLQLLAYIVLNVTFGRNFLVFVKWITKLLLEFSLIWVNLKIEHKFWNLDIEIYCFTFSYYYYYFKCAKPVINSISDNSLFNSDVVTQKDSSFHFFFDLISNSCRINLTHNQTRLFQIDLDIRISSCLLQSSMVSLDHMLCMSYSTLILLRV